MLIACTRMYNVTPDVTNAWKLFLDKVASRAGVPMNVIDYPAPAPLEDLWSRPDMGCVFMCGWPFQRREPKPKIVAAPLPASDLCQGPNYCTVMVVNAVSDFHTIEDTFGGRIAWTDAGSHSGFNAPRKLLLEYQKDGAPLYHESLGPVVTPRASLATVLEGTADVAPLDSYFYELLKKHEPETAAQLRVVDRTPCAPVPLLIAARDADDDQIEALRGGLVSAASEDDLIPLLDTLCLEGFARVDSPERYDLTAQWDNEAKAAGYSAPA